MHRVRFDDPPAVETAGNGKHAAIPKGQHATNGRFLPGNKCASGRRSRAAWGDAFDAACTPDDLRAIVLKAVQQAKAGDRFAREWIGSYALQRPARLLDVRLDDDRDAGPPDMTDPANALLRVYD